MFLAAILVAGTITALFPSFMVGTAQAVPYPDMDREKKEDKKSVSVSSLKCNNINVNVNGLELDVFPPFLANSGLAAEAVEDNTGPSSIASNGDSSEINDFRFICINNNNNTAIGGGEKEPATCEECFEAFLNQDQIEAIEDEAGMSIEQFCALNTSSGIIEEDGFRTFLDFINVDPGEIDKLIVCLKDVGFRFV